MQSIKTYLAILNKADSPDDRSRKADAPCHAFHVVDERRLRTEKVLEELADPPNERPAVEAQYTVGEIYGDLLRQERRSRCDVVDDRQVDYSLVAGGAWKTPRITTTIQSEGWKILLNIRKYK